MPNGFVGQVGGEVVTRFANPGRKLRRVLKQVRRPLVGLTTHCALRRHDSWWPIGFCLRRLKLDLASEFRRWRGKIFPLDGRRCVWCANFGVIGPMRVVAAQSGPSARRANSVASPG